MTVLNALRPDLIVDGLGIADPKVVTNFNDSHVAQMLGYLSITGLEKSACPVRRGRTERRWGRSVLYSTGSIVFCLREV